MEPVAARGRRKLNSSAVIASAQRISASATMPRDATGECRKRPDVHTTARLATPAT
jgi:hypothetical protein